MIIISTFQVGKLRLGDYSSLLRFTQEWGWNLSLIQIETHAQYMIKLQFRTHSSVFPVGSVTLFDSVQIEVLPTFFQKHSKLLS